MVLILAFFLLWFVVLSVLPMFLENSDTDDILKLPE